MDIYPSLMTTLLATVFATQAWAGDYSTGTNYTAPHVSSVRASGVASPSLMQKGLKANVNVNSADAETLALELKGIGPKRAQAIIAFREKHGPFKSIEEIAKVRGISKKILERNRDKITIEEGVGI